MPQQKSLGDLIKLFREKNRTSQLDLSIMIAEMDPKLSKLDRTTISKWESDDSVPSSRNLDTTVRVLSEILSQSSYVIKSAISETNRRRGQVSDLAVGNYELFQWSYRADKHIMKTNISVFSERSGNKLVFTEDVEVRSQKGLIKGSVTVAAPNLFFNGQGRKPFVECETILISIPRGDLWVRGIVLGVSSDRHAYPSASRAIVKCIGQQEFSTPPLYEPLNEINLPKEHKDYLSVQPSADWPVLTSRDIRRLTDGH
jgi:hypothetical protein